MKFVAFSTYESRWRDVTLVRRRRFCATPDPVEVGCCCYFGPKVILIAKRRRRGLSETRDVYLEKKAKDRRVNSSHVDAARTTTATYWWDHQHHRGPRRNHHGWWWLPHPMKGMLQNQPPHAPRQSWTQCHQDGYMTGGSYSTMSRLHLLDERDTREPKPNKLYQDYT
jgi:hypothetical protein